MLWGTFVLQRNKVSYCPLETLALANHLKMKQDTEYVKRLLVLLSSVEMVTRAWGTFVLQKSKVNVLGEQIQLQFIIWAWLAISAILLYLPLTCNSSPFSICGVTTITPDISTYWQRKVLSYSAVSTPCMHSVQVIVQVPQTSASDLEAAQKAKTAMILGRAGVGPTTGKPAHHQQQPVQASTAAPPLPSTAYGASKTTSNKSSAPYNRPPSPQTSKLPSNATTAFSGAAPPLPSTTYGKPSHNSTNSSTTVKRTVAGGPVKSPSPGPNVANSNYVPPLPSLSFGKPAASKQATPSKPPSPPTARSVSPQPGPVPPVNSVTAKYEAMKPSQEPRKSPAKQLSPGPPVNSVTAKYEAMKPSQEPRKSPAKQLSPGPPVNSVTAKYEAMKPSQEPRKSPGPPVNSITAKYESMKPSQVNKSPSTPVPSQPSKTPGQPVNSVTAKYEAMKPTSVAKPVAPPSALVARPPSPKQVQPVKQWTPKPAEPVKPVSVSKSPEPVKHATESQTCCSSSCKAC
jgi:hypothetical protein